jgi:hypothetical protein
MGPPGVRNRNQAYFQSAFLKGKIIEKFNDFKMVPGAESRFPAKLFKHRGF